MFKEISEALTFVINANQRIEANKRQTDALASRIEMVGDRVTAVAIGLQELRAEFRAFVQHERDEREKQELRFQLALERLERRLALPPAPSSSAGA